MRFYHSFGIKNAVMCVIIGMAAFLLYLYTIVFRPQYSRRQYELTLFWSYKRAFHGATYLWIEIILNFILFMPVGILIPALINHEKIDIRKCQWEDGEKRTFPAILSQRPV